MRKGPGSFHGNLFYRALFSLHLYEEQCVYAFALYRLLQSNTVKPVHVITSIKQSPVLKGHLLFVLS